MIKLLRVDSRLIHGQVAISWTRTINADCILIANDEVAQDEVRQSLLRISKPQGIKLVIKLVDDSISAIKKGVTDKYNLLIVVNNVLDAERLALGCKEIKSVNLGVLPFESGKKQLSKAIFVTEEDIKIIKNMIKNNIEVEIRQVPTESKLIVTEKFLNE